MLNKANPKMTYELLGVHESQICTCIPYTLAVPPTHYILQLTNYFQRKFLKCNQPMLRRPVVAQIGETDIASNSVTSSDHE